MSRSPSSYLSKLSLQGTPPPSELGTSMQSGQKKSAGPGSDQYSDSDESDWEEDDEVGDVVTSPSGLRYNIRHLSPTTQKVVRSAFNDQEPPKIYLESCGIKEEGTGGDDAYFYAFQMHEVVPCSVRIGARDSARWSLPECRCPEARYRRKRPCKHLVWLFDSISKQALLNQGPGSELTMTELGYPQELGDPFRRISEFRLDILADSLHSDVTTRNGDAVPLSRARIAEAREMVATLAGIEPRDIDTFRPDLDSSFRRNDLIHRGDLEATLFSLILASQSLAACIRTKLASPDLAVDPFRAIQRRATRIISELDTYSLSLQSPDMASKRWAEGEEAEGPRNVGWAATQIRNCVAQVDRLVSRGSRPLTGPERASAARTLVGILKAVASHNFDSHGGGTVDDRNLYMCLVGNQDTGFVHSALDNLVDQSQFVEELELIMELIGRYGAPESYVANLRRLITRMRSHTGEDSRRPSVTFSTESVPRSATPPLEGVPPVGPRPEFVSEPVSGGLSGSGSVQFLTPDIPASASRSRGRGGRSSRGGRGRGADTGSLGPSGAEPSSVGSKRSTSGNGQDRGKGPKRPR